MLPKNSTQCPRPGLEPGPLDPGTSALAMRPPRLHKESTMKKKEIPVKQGHTRELLPNESDDDEEAEKEVEASV